MKILLDECVPLQVRNALEGHEVMTVQKMGWHTRQAEFSLGSRRSAAERKNGELQMLDRAEREGFQIFILADKNLRYQQNLSGRKIAILELWTNHLPTLEKYSAEIRATAEKLGAGDYFTFENPLKRLGKNHGAYHGETIDIRATLKEIEAAAEQHGWASEVFHEAAGFKWLALRRPSRIPHPLSCRSPAKADASRIYISAGIHGDEPAAPLAALRLLQENQWPENAEIFLLPCLNPVGYTLNKRENTVGLDLNRDYRNSKAAETQAHIAWLQRQPKFDLYLCLHEDWESHGFYLYEQNPDGKPSFAEKMIQAVQAVCPIDQNEMIEGRPAQGGIIRPIVNPPERPDWPEAFYLISHKARQGYTLEAPSDFDLPVRVNALLAAATTAVKALTANRQE